VNQQTRSIFGSRDDLLAHPVNHKTIRIRNKVGFDEQVSAPQKSVSLILIVLAVACRDIGSRVDSLL
jgi:hypothetical protein